MSTRPLEWNGNPKVPRADLVVPVSADGGASGAAAQEGDGEMTLSQRKKLAKQKANEEKKAAKAAEKAAKAS
jgi:tryptophanyl-tRNA synthetase